MPSFHWAVLFVTLFYGPVYLGFHRQLDCHWAGGVKHRIRQEKQQTWCNRMSCLSQASFSFPQINGLLYSFTIPIPMDLLLTEALEWCGTVLLYGPLLQWKHKIVYQTTPTRGKPLGENEALCLSKWNYKKVSGWLGGKRVVFRVDFPLWPMEITLVTALLMQWCFSQQAPRKE